MAHLYAYSAIEKTIKEILIKARNSTEAMDLIQTMDGQGMPIGVRFKGGLKVTFTRDFRKAEFSLVRGKGLPMTFVVTDKKKVTPHVCAGEILGSTRRRP